MCDQQQLTRLISDVYDTVFDAARWPGVLAAVADFAGGQAGGLLVKDATNKCVAANCHAGVDPHFIRLYTETYSSVGPLATSQFCGVDQIVSIPELVPYDEYRHSRFYQEWAKPQGWEDIAFAVLEKSAAGCSCLSMVRHESNGMVDDEMRRRIALVLPHLRRALLINRTVEFKQTEAATFADVLDGLSAGLFLIDANGRIVHANAAANELVDGGDLLRSSCGRLVANDPEVDCALREIAAAAGSGDAAVGTKGIVLPLTAHDGEPCVVHVLPLTSGARGQAGAIYTAVAAVFVRKVGLDSPPSSDVIGKTYNLTPAELRVLLGIVEIGGVPDVAAALGVADTTVKTHLGRLFEKTGTGRQADLVKLVAGFSTPLAN